MEVFYIKILVTGGLGYIGSNTCVQLLNSGHDVIVIDNLYNSNKKVIDEIKNITKKDITFYERNVCNYEAVDEIFSTNKIDAVIHFAAYKAVGESVKFPLKYYENNLLSTINICKAMEKYNCHNLIFSSSATVYGSPKYLPIDEKHSLSTTNPYGTTKLMNEKILEDFTKANNEVSVIILRYFNPIGALAEGFLGENPNGIPNNLMPYIMRVAENNLKDKEKQVKEYESLHIFGDDYNTKDGTGVRDYIHVVDLAKGHLKAIEHITDKKGIRYYNLGTGKGTSVLELVKTYEKVNQVKVPYIIEKRRPGDIDACYADVELAKKELDWQAEYNIEDMCKSSFAYEQNYIKNNKSSD